jgi:hypothetical protein
MTLLDQYRSRLAVEGLDEDPDQLVALEAL